jgi:kynurenine formamidase
MKQVAIVILALLGFFPLVTPGRAQEKKGSASASKSAPVLPKANRPSPQKDQWMKELSNAGRWGANDELGTLNLITPAKRVSALSLAKTGTVVSLMRPVVFTQKSPAIQADQKPDGNPYFEFRFRHFPSESRYSEFSSDIQEYAMHGALLTHLDAFCHDSYNGKMYNEVPVESAVDPVKGCRKLGVQNLKEGFITRGILIDFPKLRGRALQPGEKFMPVDLAAWEKMSGVKLSAGDAVFLYTGIKDGKPDSGAGYDLAMMPVFKQRDVALISADGPNADHQLSLAALGAYLLDNAELSGLAETATRLKRWEFLLMVSPITAPGGTGSLVNPLAVF